MTKQEKIEAQEQKSTHSTIAAALAAAQSEMGRAKKDSSNPHFKSKYADLDSVCDAAMPSLNRHGIAVVQPTERMGDEWVMVTRFIHAASAETLETAIPLLMGKNDMQGLGSAMTYARRYGLMSLAGIAPEDDDGSAAAEAAKRAEAQRKAEDEARLATQISDARGQLESAESLEELRETWAALPKPVQHQAAVIAAKDARKAALEKAAQDEPAHPPIDDEIPY